MGKGLFVFTEGKEVVGGKITKANITADTLEVAYEYKIENIGYTGVFKATSSDGERWSGGWTDRNQKWKSFSGEASVTSVKNQSRCLFYGTWEATNPAGDGEWTMDIELPRVYR
jgi:hypothetical protein